MDIPMYNKTHEDLILIKGTLIATVYISNQDIDLQSFNIHIFDLQLATTQQINSLNTPQSPHFTKDDQAMSEEVKKEAFLDLM
jgi:hypothetical protein